MNYANIKYYDIANGPGIRTSLFVSGCNHRCEGCFNSEAWDFNYGNLFDDNIENRIIEHCRSSYISGLSILGGEPMEPNNQITLVSLLKHFRKELPHKSIWCYTGCTYEELIGKNKSNYHCEQTIELLSYIDILVDGLFIMNLKDISLKFRGSSNQRIIDIKKTLSSDKIILWKDDQLLYD